MRDARYNTEVIRAIEALAEHNRPFVRAGAVVGMSGIHRAVFGTILLFTRRALRAFDELEAAKDWLVDQ